MTLRFGTDGVRGPADEFSDALVSALGEAAGRVLGNGSEFLIGRDTRESGPRIERALAVGMARADVEPVSLGVIPTPAVAWVSAQRGVPGAVISASHNPWSDNGIKFFAAGGHKLSDEVEDRLEALLDELIEVRSTALSSNGPSTDGPSTDGPVIDGASIEGWCDAVAGSTVGPVGSMRIVIDCANGASSRVAPRILESLGVVVDVIHATPDGRNINDGCGSTHPEDLQRRVVEIGAALGLAFDGDADRLLAVDEHGELVDGDHLLALFAVDLRARGALADDQVVVTVMTNLGFRLAMEEQGITVVETPVGDRHVLEALDRTGGSLGGEQSGHIVFADWATTGDGVLSGVKLLDLVVRSGQPLSELAAGSMTRLPQVLRNVRVADRRPDVAEAVAAEVAEAEAELGARGRVLIRPSGTEPLVRVMVEAPSVEQAEALAGRLATAVERACSA
jgi:phosphoglucosamine mutase